MYRVATELATFVSKEMEVKYPGVFKHLRRILQEEGLEHGVPTMKESVFTTFTVTRDFSCHPHTDDDDYDLGFVIWLREGPSVVPLVWGRFESVSRLGLGLSARHHCAP